MDNDRLKSTLENVETLGRFVDKNVKKVEKKHGKRGAFIFLCLILIVLGLTVTTWKGIISAGVKSAFRNYAYTKEEYETSASNKYHEIAYNKIIETHQAVNDVYITVDTIRETANLQVLTATERVFVKQTPDEEKNDGVIYWIIFSGTGTYSINMNMCEFIVDNERHFVQARIPRPEVKIDITNEKIELEKNITKLSDGSEARGREIMRAARERGYGEISDKILGDLELIRKAEEAAKKQVELLIRALNPSVTDLTIEVLFFD